MKIVDVLNAFLDEVPKKRKPFTDYLNAEVWIADPNTNVRRRVHTVLHEENAVVIWMADEEAK